MNKILCACLCWERGENRASSKPACRQAGPAVELAQPTRVMLGTLRSNVSSAPPPHIKIYGFIHIFLYLCKDVWDENVQPSEQY